MPPRRDPQEIIEKIRSPYRGPQGETGEQGARGERGMPASQRRAIVYIFLLNLAITAVTGFGLFHYVNSNSHERCSSIAQIVRIPVPHPVAGNPSREWEAAYEAIEQHRFRQLGCR